jgi:KipI family sensor histidine kinase inhibitor
MGLHQLGDSAWIFKSGAKDAHGHLTLIQRLLKILQKHRIPEIVDVVSSFHTIAVHFNPSDGETIFKHLTALHLDDASDEVESSPQTVTIPVVYGGEYGPDLRDLAKKTKLSEKELIQIHSETEFTVAAIGFSPGFPYLAGLPKILSQPRLASPRKVAAGSVAIANDQAGIYPFASQGGWLILGRTNRTLFDPHREQPSLLKSGDKVRFESVDHLDFTAPPAEATHDTDGSIQILDPGPLSSIQDHGRYGRQHLGVSPGGAVDPTLATIANRLVGNPDNHAVIECTMAGPILLFHENTRVAWIGWSHPDSGKPVDIKAGDTVDLSDRTIAVAGGIDVPLIMRSRSTDIRAQFGGFHGRVLRSGDRLKIGQSNHGPTSGSWHVAWPQPNRQHIELRFIRGMQADWFNQESYAKFTKTFYQISPASDRMGTRLVGAKLILNEAKEMVSQPVVYGSIQVPPDGQPIILMSERQTIGGYPQIGHVISADLPILARAWPGTQIQFREVSLDDARDAWFELQRELGMLHAGLMTQFE